MSASRLPLLDELLSKPLAYQCDYRPPASHRNSHLIPCADCKKNVVNLSRMPQREALTHILNQAPEDVCIAYRRDPQTHQVQLAPEESPAPHRTANQEAPARFGRWAHAWVGLGMLAASSCQAPPSLHTEAGEPSPPAITRVRNQLASWASDARMDSLSAWLQVRDERVMEMGESAMHLAPEATLYFEAPRGHTLTVNGYVVQAGSHAFVPEGANTALVRDHHGTELYRGTLQFKGGDTKTIYFK